MLDLNYSFILLEGAMKPEYIKENLLNLTDGQLEYFLVEYPDLNNKINILLRKEVERRNGSQKELYILDFLTKQKNRINVLPTKELETEVVTRLKSGENIEDLKFDLKAKGHAFSEILDRQNKHDQIILDTVTFLQNENVSKIDFQNYLNSQLGVNEEDYHRIYLPKLENRKGAKSNKNIVLACLGLLLLVFALYINSLWTYVLVVPISLFLWWKSIK